MGMLELVFVGLLGLLVGIALGLFSVFPIYFAGFVVYALHPVWSPELLLVFWATAAIGSQFFGSVSTITLGIPGEASALVWINDLKGMSLRERNHLLYHTARGSLVAGMIALGVVWIAYHWISAYSYFLSSVNFVLAMFTLVIALFAYSYWAIMFRDIPRASKQLCTASVVVSCTTLVWQHQLFYVDCKYDVNTRLSYGPT
jgi:TctA family transporter